jgi:predicted esterase
MLTGGRAASAASFGLVLLHGRGAGARDIMGLGEALALPDLALVAPEAPGFSWWPTSFLAPSAVMEPHVSAGLAAVHAAIAEYERAGLPRARIGLVGFSQGGCLAAEYLARRGAGLGCGFVLSGGLVGTADAGPPDPALYGHADKSLDYVTDLSGAAVYMSCHENDPHIPFKRFADSARVLSGLGASVTERAKPGAGHGIDEVDIAALRSVLNRPGG